MSKNKSDLRIGQLLIEAQILRARDLGDAIKIAKLTGLPVGRILIMSSYVDEREFQAAVQAQSLVRDSILPFPAAIEALSLMSRTELSFEDCLNEVGWARAKDATTNKLGEMLLEAQVISQEQMDVAIRTSQATGLPLGRVLVSLGDISDETLTTALNTQVLVRDKKITREQGINGLKAAFHRRLPLELALAEKGFYRGPIKPSIRLGELLVLAELVPPIEIMNALEIGLVRQQALGQVLVHSRQILPRTLNTALELQEMVANQTVDENQAADILKHVVGSGKTVEELVAELEVPQTHFKTTVRLHDLLRVAGLLQHSDIELSDIRKGVEPSSVDAKTSANGLLNNGFIDKRTYHAALRCYFLCATGWMSIQQGIIALNYFSHQAKFTFDEVLQELDWTVRTRPQFAETTYEERKPV